MATARTATLRVPLDLDPGESVAALRSASRAVLEGGPGFGDAGRWDVYGLRSVARFASDGPGAGIWSFGPSRTRFDEPLDALAEILKRYGLAAPTDEPDPDGPPFQGGMLGFFGYDLARSLERLPARARADSRLPDIRFELYDTVAVRDGTTGRTEILACDFAGEGDAAVRRRVDSHRRALEDPAIIAVEPSRLCDPPRSPFTKGEYVAAVARALEYIRAGDIFQVNLSQRFTARGKFRPLDLYRRLRERSPAPFSAYLALGRDDHVISASPESFYQTRGDRIVTRPIKGTRPRGATPSEDARLAAELQASPKDRAELTMIVDLERNDLGRVCRYGSVRVTEPLTIESYAQVHHLVATVEGRLRPGVGPIDVVKAMFPGGSITGAPKIRAMEIIDELEPTRRGLYTGAIGYFGRGGASAFNIAIRTILVEGDRASYQVGGGIVADSDPESEYEETLHKGRAMRDVLEGEGVGP